MIFYFDIIIKRLLFIFTINIFFISCIFIILYIFIMFHNILLSYILRLLFIILMSFKIKCLIKIVYYLQLKRRIIEMKYYISIQGKKWIYLKRSEINFNLFIHELVRINSSLVMKYCFFKELEFK